MKTHTLSLLLLTFCLGFAAAAPEDWIGKLIPQLVLTTGETYQDARIRRIGEETVLIEHRGGRAEIRLADLSATAQAALGYDPQKAAAAGEVAMAVRILQVVEGGYVVREFFPAERKGSAQKMTDQIMGRSSRPARDEVGERLYYLEGDTGLATADGDLLDVTVDRPDETKTLQRVTGGTATMRVLRLKSAKPISR